MISSFEICTIILHFDGVKLVTAGLESRDILLRSTQTWIPGARDARVHLRQDLQSGGMKRINIMSYSLWFRPL